MAGYTIPAISAVNFTDDETPYTVPAINAVDFDFLEGPQIAIPSPLGSPALVAEMDWYHLIVGTVESWVMKISGSPELEIPISSWQGTIQVDRQTFLQAVVPAATDYVSDISARVNSETFTIYRRYQIAGGGTQDEPILSAPLDTVTIYSGPFRESATLIGYGAIASGALPAAERTMSNVRTLTTTVGGNVRARGDIDPLFVPGNDINADGQTIAAAFISYFVTSGGDSYMDVGTR
jgi:hypothetical protein